MGERNSGVECWVGSTIGAEAANAGHVTHRQDLSIGLKQELIEWFLAAEIHDASVAELGIAGTIGIEADEERVLIV